MEQGGGCHEIRNGIQKYALPTEQWTHRSSDALLFSKVSFPRCTWSLDGKRSRAGAALTGFNISRRGEEGTDREGVERTEDVEELAVQ